MKKGPTKTSTRKAVTALEKKGKKEKKRLWLEAARIVSGPRRNRVSVSLKKLCRLEKKLVKKTALVPGKVLGNECSGKINVMALEYSKSARNAIERAGGEAKTIPEALEKASAKNTVMVK